MLYMNMNFKSLGKLEGEKKSFTQDLSHRKTGK